MNCKWIGQQMLLFYLSVVTNILNLACWQDVKRTSVLDERLIMTKKTIPSTAALNLWGRRQSEKLHQKSEDQFDSTFFAQTVDFEKT